ncbi:MAG TPA: helix-turn-helix domain-containing protein [Candidatus Methylomirabilis sp.]|nr:helix-turn-helix domain-containing protein [Candidatus Methylomirabilis sp.]
MRDQLEALVNLMIERGVEYEDAVCEFEKKFIGRMLEKTNGNQSKAAQALRIHRNTLSRKIDEFRLDHQPRRRRRPRKTRQK